MIPCMPMCMNPCEPSHPPPPAWVPPQAPEIIIDVTNNMEAELTQILHEIINIGEIEPPTPGEPGPDLIDIILPMAQMFLNTDVYPNFPYCPEATESLTGSFLGAENNPLSHLTDPTAVLGGVLERVLEFVDDPTVLEGEDLVTYIDLEGIIEDVLVTDADGHTHEIVVTELDGGDDKEEDADAGEDETPADDSTDADTVTEDDTAEDASDEVETEEAEVVAI